MKHRLSITIAAALLALTATAALAQDAGRAAALNDRGKKLFADKKYFEAYKLFKQATELDPKGKYFFNECFTLNFLERYRDAVAACEQVEPNGADADLVDKTNGLLTELRKRVPPEPGPGDNPDNPDNPDVNNPDNPDVNNPDNPDNPDVDPNNPDDPNGPVSGGTPPPGPVQPDAFIKGGAPDIQSYKWSVGGELGPMVNLGIGNDSGDQQFAAGGFYLRGFANFLLSEQRRFGIQGSLAFTTLTPGDNSFDDTGISVIDVGGGAYKHFPLGRNMVLTPLVGVGLSLFQPELSTEFFAGGTARLESSFAFLFGSRGQHVISVTPALNVYSAASGNIEAGAAEDFNLDKPSASITISLGYSLRFATPFGASPLITLE